MRQKLIFSVVLFSLFSFVLNVQSVIKVGIIGLDTSHSPAFIEMLNSAQPKAKYEGFRIVAAYPYGSRTIESSYKRIPDYTEKAKKAGVEIVGSIAELLPKVDCIMLETNDGCIHLEQAAEVIKAGKPLFIDKPIAATLADAIAIFRLAERYNVPLFSSSSLRYSTITQEIASGKYGKVLGADCYSPHHREPTHPDFGWYGIHGVETLYTLMGTGCQSVTRTHSDVGDVVTGLWKDGRTGVFRALCTGAQDYGGTAFCEKKVVQAGPYMGYEVLLDKIIEFFRTKEVPIPSAETIEMFAFMEASNQSVKQQGKPVLLEKVYAKGEKDAAKILKKYIDNK